jgi:hypothetical protein
MTAPLTSAGTTMLEATPADLPDVVRLLRSVIIPSSPE